MLHDVQRNFAAALFGGEATLPLAGDPDRLSTGIAIYANNVFHRLAEGLRDAFPTVGQLVGDECFKALAVGFVRAVRPGERHLLRCLEGFPAFLDDHPVATDLPFLADVARLELAYLRAYHDTDAVAAPAMRSTAEFALHPTAHLMSSPHPIFEIWSAHRPHGPALEDVEPGPCKLVVFRPDVDVIVRPLGSALYAALAQAGRLTLNGVLGTGVRPSEILPLVADGLFIAAPRGVGNG